MFQLLGVEVTKALLLFDTTVISRVQKVGSIVPLESRIYALWSLNIGGGNILFNSVGTETPKVFPRRWLEVKCHNSSRFLPSADQNSSIVLPDIFRMPISRNKRHTPQLFQIVIS